MSSQVYRRPPKPLQMPAGKTANSQGLSHPLPELVIGIVEGPVKCLEDGMRSEGRSRGKNYEHVSLWKEKKSGGHFSAVTYLQGCVPSEFISIASRQEREAEQREEKSSFFQMKSEVGQHCNHGMGNLSNTEQGLKERVSGQAMFTGKTVSPWEARISCSHRSCQKRHCPPKAACSIKPPHGQA